jgi:LacI family transcriptional regulator
MHVTIKDVAQKAGVSTATVSMVINHKSSRISDRTKQNILKVIEELGYHPNYAARSLMTSRTKTISLVVPDVSNPFFADFAKCFESRLSQRDYSVLLCNSGNDIKREKKYLSEAIYHSTDALVISSVNIEELSQTSLFKQIDIPILLFDRKLHSNTVNTIFIDNFHGGYLAAKELVEHHHTNICCISGSFQLPTVKERFLGFEQYLYECQIPFDPSNLFEGELTIEHGYQSALKILNSERRKNITAVFCTNDLIAAGVYKALSERHIQIPDSFSIVGFDNIALSSFLSPPLTTIAQPVRELGEQSADLIIELLSGITSLKQVCLPISIVRRESVKFLER